MKPVKNKPASLHYQIGDIIQPYVGGCYYEILDLNGTIGCFNNVGRFRLRCIPLNTEGDYCFNQGRDSWILIRRNK